MVLVSLAMQVAAGDFDPGTEAQQGIDRLASLAGEWQVTGTMLDLDGTAVKIRSKATIKRNLEGASVEERSSYLLPPHAVEFFCIRSWDSFRGRYRMACIDSLTGLRYFVINTKWYLSRNTACDDRLYSTIHIQYPKPPEGFA